MPGDGCRAAAAARAAVAAEADLFSEAVVVDGGLWLPVFTRPPLLPRARPCAAAAVSNLKPAELQSAGLSNSTSKVQSRAAAGGSNSDDDDDDDDGEFDDAEDDDEFDDADNDSSQYLLRSN